MTEELAEHISLLAVSLYAAMLAPLIERDAVMDAGQLRKMRQRAIGQARALWLETLGTED